MQEPVLQTLGSSLEILNAGQSGPGSKKCLDSLLPLRDPRGNLILLTRDRAQKTLIEQMDFVNRFFHRVIRHSCRIGTIAGSCSWLR